jgi:hypothetical protein
MARVDIERQMQLESKRLQFAKSELKRRGVQFNVVEQRPERKNVDAIKFETAKLIDFCQDGKNDVNKKEWNDNAKAEANQLWSLAQTAYEEAALWAAKAATYGL